MQVTMRNRWQGELIASHDTRCAAETNTLCLSFFLRLKKEKKIHLLLCLIMPRGLLISLLSAVDVKSWLVMFGFQLSNIIPGFPRHTLYFVEPPYELQATQHCENGQVRTTGHKKSIITGRSKHNTNLKTDRKIKGPGFDPWFESMTFLFI